MTCCGCGIDCRISKNGLCTGCKQDAARPTLHRRLRVKAAARWTEGENEVLLIRYKLSQRQAVDRSIVALMRMEKLFGRAVVYAMGLDNPYMQEHARATVVGYIYATQAWQGRKPVAAVPAPAARKKAA
jgi:hypothetical protein